MADLRTPARTPARRGHGADTDLPGDDPADGRTRPAGGGGIRPKLRDARRRWQGRVRRAGAGAFPVLRRAPLPWRIGIARVVGRWTWFGAREQVIRHLLLDFADEDPSAFHRRLWSEHLFYAETYDSSRFERGLDGVRRMLMTELDGGLASVGRGRADIGSICEVGCSVGHVLRIAERQLFPQATRLVGVDIDETAIRTGRRCLAEMGSRIELRQGDVAELDSVVGAESFDLVLAAGVLMYLDAATARLAVASLLAHARTAVAIADLAHPDVDNRALGSSVPRRRDGALIHNLDSMVDGAGGTVVARRWGGSLIVEGQPVYLLVAAPPVVQRPPGKGPS